MPDPAASADPGYLALHASGELAARAKKALAMLSSCVLCPRRCKADRLADETGFCLAGRRAPVAQACLHFGEESPLVGERGSGTIFFAGCNLGCVFCQNMDISRDVAGAVEATAGELADAMLALAEEGAANINLVTPSHVVPQILEALNLAAARGLRLPLVYNTSGYDSLAALRLMDGVVDIYMPDAKIWDQETAGRLLGAPDYPERARAAIREMFRQTGDLAIGPDGLAVRGLLVRHLVMPGGLAGTEKWMDFLAREISRATYVNIMDQYRPCGKAHEYAEISRETAHGEWLAARRAAVDAGLTRLDERGEDHLRRLARILAAR